MSLVAVHQVQHTKSQAVPTTVNETATATITAKAAEVPGDVTPAALAEQTVQTMFALPRVNLKTSPNSTALTNCADDVQLRFASQQIHTRPSSQSHPEPPTSFELSGGGDQSTTVAAQPQLSSLQHYSTEKSGSSGYYSSHVYSTSSFDDHIYSEPVGGGSGGGASGLVVSRGACGTGTTEAVVAAQDSISRLTAPTLYGVPSASALSSVSVAKKLAHNSVNVSASQAQASRVKSAHRLATEPQRMQPVGIMPAIQRQQHPPNHTAHQLYYHYQQYQQQHPHHQSAGLVNLESSIKNLELHLKAFSRPPSVQSAPYTDVHFDDDDSGSGSIDHKYEKRKSVRLPTIMEGIDGQPTQSQQITQQTAAATANEPTAHVAWQDMDPDDSLMDLDLDSFMMANELTKKAANPNQQPPQPATFVSDSVEEPAVAQSNDLTYDNKSIENNYKCRKYINSCPDDPYNIEEPSPGATDSQQPPHPPPTFDKSTLSSYLHQCNDRLHYQSTRHILEEIRVKLTALLKPSNIASSSDGANQPSSGTHSSGQAATVDGDASQLQHSIESLKGDLDNYLGIMNASNELEIRQLCNGLSKDHKLVRIQNALGNRDSTRRIHCPDRTCSNYVSPSPTSSPAANNAVEPNAPVGSNSMATTATATATATTASLSSYTEREETQFDTVYVRDGFSFGYKSKIPFRLDFSKTQPASRAPNNSAASHYDASHVHTIASQRVHPTDVGHGAKYKCSPCSSCEEMMNTTGSSQDDEGDTNSGEGYTASTSDDLVRYRQTIADLACSMQHPAGHTLGPPVMLRYPAQVYDSRRLIRPDELKAPVGAFYQPTQQQQLQHAADYHQNKPSIWEQYYGTNRMNHTFFKIIKGHHHSIMSYPSERPESDFTLDLPQAEQLRLKMKREKQFRHRCRIVTSFLSLVFFLLTVVVVSLLLTRGKHPFGSMI